MIRIPYRENGTFWRGKKEKRKRSEINSASIKRKKKESTVRERIGCIGQRPRLQDRVTQERRGKWVASRGREAREESSVIRGVGSVSSPKAARCSRMEGGGWQKRGKRVGGWTR